MQYNLEELGTITLLYVEDEDDIKDNISRTFEKLFKKVYLASNGQEGLEIFEKYKDDIEIIITDINMPILNGLDMIEKIQYLSNIPIIVTTAHTDKNILLQAIDMNISKYITKPIKIKELVNSIAQLTFDNRELNNKNVATASLAHNSKIINKKNKKLELDSTNIKNELNFLQNLTNHYISSIITDKRGIIINVSSKFLKLYEYTNDEIIGKNITQIQDDDTHTTEIQKYMLEMIHKKESVYAVHMFKTKSGKSLECDMRIIPSYNSDGYVDGYTFYQDLIHI